MEFDTFSGPTSSCLNGGTLVLLFVLILCIHHPSPPCWTLWWAANDCFTQGVLHLVDLAGSERIDRSGVGADAQRLRETQSINKSLSCLADVFSSLAAKSSHIPFRNSKLTYLMQVKAACPTHKHTFVLLAVEWGLHFDFRVFDIQQARYRPYIGLVLRCQGIFCPRVRQAYSYCSACNGVHYSSHSMFRRRRVACAHGSYRWAHDIISNMPWLLAGVAALLIFLQAHMLSKVYCSALTAKQSTASFRQTACTVFFVLVLISRLSCLAIPRLTLPWRVDGAGLLVGRWQGSHVR